MFYYLFAPPLTAVSLKKGAVTATGPYRLSIAAAAESEIRLSPSVATTKASR